MVSVRGTTRATGGAGSVWAGAGAAAVAAASSARMRRVVRGMAGPGDGVCEKLSTLTIVVRWRVRQGEAAGIAERIRRRGLSGTRPGPPRAIRRPVVQCGRGPERSTQVVEKREDLMPRGTIYADVTQTMG